MPLLSANAVLIIEDQPAASPGIKYIVSRYNDATPLRKAVDSGKLWPSSLASKSQTRFGLPCATHARFRAPFGLKKAIPWIFLGLSVLTVPRTSAGNLAFRTTSRVHMLADSGAAGFPFFLRVMGPDRLALVAGRCSRNPPPISAIQFEESKTQPNRNSDICGPLGKARRTVLPNLRSPGSEY